MLSVLSKMAARNCIFVKCFFEKTQKSAPLQLNFECSGVFWLNLVTLGKQSHSYYRSYRHTDRLFQSESTHQLTSFVFLHNVSSFVCLAAPIEKEHRRPACAPSQPCLYSAFENSTPLFFFSRICAIRSAICAAASTGGTPCLLIFDTTVYSDSSMSGLAW